MSGTTNVYSFLVTLDGERSEVNVWADDKAEAARLLRSRFSADGVTVGIDTARKLTTADAKDHGCVLVIR